MERVSSFVLHSFPGATKRRSTTHFYTCQHDDAACNTFFYLVTSHVFDAIVGQIVGQIVLLLLLLLLFAAVDYSIVGIPVCLCSL